MCSSDLWATVGSCAQIGKNVHLSGGVGIGGVLEPLQAAPVIVEDNAFIGSRCIVVEGARIYHALVEGRPDKSSGTIREWLLEDKFLKVKSVKKNHPQSTTKPSRRALSLKIISLTSTIFIMVCKIKAPGTIISARLSLNESLYVP